MPIRNNAQTVPAAPADASCEEAFRQIVLNCARAMDVALAEFLETEQEAGPHKARVALRRFTTAMDAFAPILRRKPAKALRKRAKVLFRMLGEVRDSDVFLRNHAGEDGHETRVKKNLALRSKVRNHLRKKRAVGFTGELTAAALSDTGIYRTSTKGVALRGMLLQDFARDALESAWMRCSDYGVAIGKWPEATMHDFRKDMKSLRYLSEFFSSQFPDLGEDPFRGDFRAMQDALGLLNDHSVAMRMLGKKRGTDVRELPAREAKALARAEAIWTHMREVPPPWRAPDDR